MSLDLIVNDVASVTDRIVMLTFRAAHGGALPAYHAGAHLDFDLGDLGIRSYSLTDFSVSTSEPVSYRIVVQKEDNGQGGSRFMHRLQKGDSLTASTPKNDFRLMNGPALLLAGGIGVTPLISFGTALAHRGLNYEFHYTSRSADQTVFADALCRLHGDRLQLWHDDSAVCDLAAIINATPRTQHIYVCGPKGMIEAVKSIASSAGFSDNRVHFELFVTPVPEDGDTAFEVEIRSSGAVITVPADKSIIDALEDAGIDLVYDCQRGDCGICQTDVLEGEPDHRDVVLSDSEKAEGNVMQICVSRSKSARLVLDL